jgi:hypothetical protein
MQSLAAGAAALALLAPTLMSEPVSPLSTPAASICRSPPRAAAAPEVRPVLLEGFGTGGFKVTDDDGAQRWFDQGMATGFAFSHRETLRAFQEAQRLDPGCAMCAWGEAWARGPTINYGVDAAARRSALAALDRVAPRTPGLDPKHRAMVAAMRLRYAEPSREDRGPADRSYAAEMERLAGLHPSDDELAVLAADALMIAGDGHGEGAGDAAEKEGPGAQPRFARAAALLSASWRAIPSTPRPSTSTFTSPNGWAMRARRWRAPTSWGGWRRRPATSCTCPRTPTSGSDATPTRRR